MNHVVFRGIVAQVGQGRTHVYLDTLGHTFTDLHVVLTGHVFLNVGGQVVTGHLDGVVRHDAAQGNHGNFSCSATDVHNHVSLGSFHIYANAHGGSHRLKYQVNVASTGMFSRVAHGTQLHFGRTAGHANDHAQCG